VINIGKIVLLCGSHRLIIACDVASHGLFLFKELIRSRILTLRVHIMREQSLVTLHEILLRRVFGDSIAHLFLVRTISLLVHELGA